MEASEALLPTPPTQSDSRKALKLRRERKRVSDRNRRFRKLSPDKQRVRIAKDVIVQLKDGRLRSWRGQYFSPSDLSRWGSVDRSTQLHVAFEEQPGCRVCALGATFVCAVKRANALRLSDGTINGGASDTQRFMRSYLGSWFSVEQLGLIEVAFEGTPRFAADGTDEDLVSAATAFYRMHWRDDSSMPTMVAIMENIIRNGGRFVPGQP